MHAMHARGKRVSLATRITIHHTLSTSLSRCLRIPRCSACRHTRASLASCCYARAKGASDAGTGGQGRNHLQLVMTSLQPRMRCKWCVAPPLNLSRSLHRVCTRA